MNLSKLFEMQKELDDYIVKTKGLEGQDLLPQKILALQVELGECANSWRKFKFWSENQESKPDLLEEYCDCLHFILSIGLTIDCTLEKTREYLSSADIIYMFTLLPFYAYCLYDMVDQEEEEWKIEEQYGDLFAGFLFLGTKLGFAWEQIEQAYTDKWNINKQRQENGY